MSQGRARWAGAGLIVALIGCSERAPSGWCQSPSTHPIVCENALPGAPPEQWAIYGAGDPSIQGFATDLSATPGERVEFKVRTDSSSYRLDIYRLGYYGGLGARLVDVVEPLSPLPQVQPSCHREPRSGLLDCGSWRVSAAWRVPEAAPSGVYLAKLVRREAGYRLRRTFLNRGAGTSHIAFVIRDDDGRSDLLFQTSDTTWQAYNTWGEAGPLAGRSLYGRVHPKARKLSYNRPFATAEEPNSASWLLRAEYPMLRWLERNGYDVSYSTGIDSDRLGEEILEHRAFLSVGHDEYWSAAQRGHVEKAREAGVHLGFFSGNEIFWKVRWEPGIAGRSHRTLVCFKEGVVGPATCGGKCDPMADTWTGLWRTGCRHSPPADGCRPEVALSGQMSWAATDSSLERIAIPARFRRMPIWRHTAAARLQPGESVALTAGVLGFEWDPEPQRRYRRSTPPGLLHLSETVSEGAYAPASFPRPLTHHLSLYRHPSGAVVFGAGTVQWSWGLADLRRPPRGPDPITQQATVNLLAMMDVQPASLQRELTSGIPLEDRDAPTSRVTEPRAGPLRVGSTVAIRGTATDEGGAVGLVEVSVDGGANWERASGAESFRYEWSVRRPRRYEILSRATDVSLNLEAPGPPVTVQGIAAGPVPAPPRSHQAR